MNDAAAGKPITFIGVPLWMGLTMALDRDLDTLYDLDELSAGTDPQSFDSDGDGFPDGYEVQHGTDPLVPGTSTPDVTSPALVAAPTLIYKTTNTIKLEFETDEICQLLVSYNGLKVVQRLPLHQKYDYQFSVIVNELKPNTLYDISLELTDPSGNVHTETVSYTTAPNYFPEPVIIEDIDLQLRRRQGAGQLLIGKVGLVAGGLPPAPGYVVTVDVFHDDLEGNLTQIRTGLQSTLVGTDGVVTFKVPLRYPQYTGPSSKQQPPTQNITGQLFVVVRDIVAPAGQPPYARALSTEILDSIGWN
jgi:hypothetical protein